MNPQTGEVQDFEGAETLDVASTENKEQIYPLSEIRIEKKRVLVFLKSKDS